MFVVGSHIGFVMVFEDKQDLETVKGHLGGMLEWIEDADVPPPHLYGVFSSQVPKEDQEAFLKSLKDGDTAGSMIVTLDDDGCCGGTECKCEED